MQLDKVVSVAELSILSRLDVVVVVVVVIVVVVDVIQEVELLYEDCVQRRTSFLLSSLPSTPPGHLERPFGNLLFDKARHSNESPDFATRATRIAISSSSDKLVDDNDMVVVVVVVVDAMKI